MAPMNQEEFPRSPVERLAWLLMESAKQDPALVGRPRPIPAGERSDLRPARPEPLAHLGLPDDGAVRMNRQIKELVSVAVASAEQAEEALHQARKARRSARLSVAVCAAVGSFGILVGVAGTADKIPRAAADMGHREVVADDPGRQSSGPTLPTAEPNGEVTPPQRSDVARGVSAEADDAAVPASSTQVATTNIAPPVYHGPIGYAAPWQASPPPVRRVATQAPRQPAPGQFMAAFRRDLSSLFRAFPH
jgi:hypothetical protein